MENPMQTTRFGLIRHAQTQWNRKKKIQGRLDSPLTAEGRQQAQKWADLLRTHPWDRIIASDTDRAFETAASINRLLQISLSSDKRLREQDWGKWTGKTVREIERDEPQLLTEQINAGWKFCPPDGEDRMSVSVRSQEALNDAAGRWPGETILVVCHEGVIKSLIYYFSGRKFVPEEPPLIKPMQLHWLIRDRNGLRIEELNALTLD
jgi:probable phosphoglycerate mutase